MNFFDSFIGVFSPRAAYSRSQYRKAIKISNQKRSYDAASRGRRTQGWKTSGASQNSENQKLPILRDRSRDLVRNNPWANRGVSLIANNTIGKGIQLNLVNPNERLQNEQRALWMKWAGSTEIDFDGCSNFAAMQNLAVRSMVESGEVLIRRRRVPRGNGIGIKLQVLESDHLADHIISPRENSNRIIQGIELDSNDKPIAYHLYKNHPGNNGLSEFDITNALDTVRVPADDIIHLFRKERPGQLRGVPWLHNAMIRLRELDEFEDAMIVRQKVAACFSAFIHDMEVPDTLNNNPNDPDFDLEKLEPGIIEHLPPGKDIKFGTPPLPQGEAYKFFINSFLHSIAVGIGTSYEALTGDLSEVNFSSARMGWLEFNRNIDVWRSNIVEPQFLQKAFNWFLESIDLLGFNITETSGTWTAPKREMIDPTKEVPAKIKSIRAGISTLSEVIREQGKDPQKHFDEIQADNIAIDNRNLILDSDPRKITAAGMNQQDNESNDNNNQRKIRTV